MDSTKKGWQSCVTTARFCLLILGFAVATIIKPPSGFSETENRLLAGMPEIRITFSRQNIRGAFRQIIPA